MTTSASKKQRLSSKVYENAVEFINKNGGFVSPSLEFSEVSRELKTTQNISAK